MARGGIIFDFDGTITKPYLDFDQIRAEIGIGAGPILEAMDKMSEEERSRADKILNRYEKEAAQHAELQPGAIEVIETLRHQGWPVAILTRNARPWVDIVLSRFGILVDTLRTREDGAIKPSPEPVLALCRQLEVEPTASWVVGDYLFDIMSGREAGTRTVLLLADRPRPDWADQADHVICHLPDLLPLVND
jgi:HAD superfamily hydrolase (TIGR01509 family)